MDASRLEHSDTTTSTTTATTALAAAVATMHTNGRNHKENAIRVFEKTPTKRAAEEPGNLQQQQRRRQKRKRLRKKYPKKDDVEDQHTPSRKRAKREIHPFAWLPDEILVSIFAFLPKEYYTVAVLVCRRWWAIVPKKERLQHKHAVVRVACETGNKPLLKWAKAQGAPVESTAYVWAARFGHGNLMHKLDRWRVPFKSDACAAAARGGHLTILQWLRSMGCEWTSITMADAAAAGHLHVLEWCRKNGCPRSSSLIASEAASNGHIHVLNWMRERGMLNDRDPPVLAAAASGRVSVLEWFYTQENHTSYQVMETGAARGHIRVVLWAASKGWKPVVGRHHIRKCFLGAVSGAHVDIMTWFHENYRLDLLQELIGGPVTADGLLQRCLTIPREKQVEVAVWLYKHDYRIKGLTVKEAIRHHNLPMVKWIYKTRYNPENPNQPIEIVLGQDLIPDAVQTEDLDLLDWLVDHGLPKTCDIYNTALQKIVDPLPILEWAYKREVPWDASVCLEAVTWANTEHVAWLRERGCPWDANVFRRVVLRASHDGRFDARSPGPQIKTLTWLIEHKCPWDKYALSPTFDDFSANVELIQWLLEQGCPWSDEVINVAVRRSTYSILNEIHKRSSSSSSASCQEKPGIPWKASHMRTAAFDYNTVMVQWLRNHGCPWDPSVFTRFIQRARMPFLEWLWREKCPWQGPITFNTAIESGCPYALLDWMLQRGCPMDTRAYRSACKRRDIEEMYQWLHSHGCPWSTDAFVWAVDFCPRSPDLFAWMVKHGCPRDVRVFTKAFAYPELMFRLRILATLWNYCPMDPNMLKSAAPQVYALLDEVWPKQWTTVTQWQRVSNQDTCSACGVAYANAPPKQPEPEPEEEDASSKEDSYMPMNPDEFVVLDQAALQPPSSPPPSSSSSTNVCFTMR